MEAGRRAGTRTILTRGCIPLVHGEDIDGPQTQFEPGEFRAANLLEAADIVIRETPARVNNRTGTMNEK
jgi:hypothetical protein